MLYELGGHCARFMSLASDQTTATPSSTPRPLRQQLACTHDLPFGA